MNNRFIKNNIGLVMITSVCLVIAVIELGVVAVHSLQMYNNIKIVKDLSGKIRTITRKRPVPVEGNKAPIEEDIRIYEEAVQKLYMKFGRPTAPAVDRFFKVLTIRKSAWLPDFEIDEKDEIVKRLRARIGRGRKLETLSNREFDECLDWLSAEELAKKIKELAADDERTKKIKELIPQLDKLDTAALTKLLYEAAALGRQLPDVELSAADLAKRIKALPADSATVKSLTEQISDFDKLDEAALAERISGEAELSRKLQETIARPELAKRIKALPADGDAAKRIKALVPDGDAGKVFVMATLDKKLRELIPDAEPEVIGRMRKIPTHFTAAEFLERYRKMLDGVEEKNYAERGRRFDNFRNFRFENWIAARAEFIRMLGQGIDPKDREKYPLCVVERFDAVHADKAENADEVLLAALGIPRVMDGEAENLKQLIDNILLQLTEKHQIKLTGRALGLGILSESGNQENAGQGGDIKSINVEDYPFVAAHLDIISYMLYRIGSKVTIWDVQIRLRASDGEGGGGRRFNESREQRDGFDIYHYTLEIEGTMDDIREAVRRLDDCYGVRRVYVVKNIALYARTNVIDSRFTGISPEERARRSAAAARPAGDPQGGRRRRYVTESPETGGNDEETRRQEQARLDAEYMAEQKRKRPVDRDGYGELITADEAKETFQAVIDIEYVVRPLNN